MALCKEYEEMTPKERQEFIGKLVHLVQSNDVSFRMANFIIKTGTIRGYLDNVTILPAENPLEKESKSNTY